MCPNTRGRARRVATQPVGAAPTTERGAPIPIHLTRIHGGTRKRACLTSLKSRCAQAWFLKTHAGTHQHVRSTSLITNHVPEHARARTKGGYTASARRADDREGSANPNTFDTNARWDTQARLSYKSYKSVRASVVPKNSCWHTPARQVHKSYYKSCARKCVGCKSPQVFG